MKAYQKAYSRKEFLLMTRVFFCRSSNKKAVPVRFAPGLPDKGLCRPSKFFAFSFANS
jgi:hypothetical protein